MAFWENFSSEFLATLIGTIIGFGLVICWDRKKKRDEEKERKNIGIQSLIGEINLNKEALQQKPDPYRFARYEVKIINIPMIVNAFNSIVASGTFSLFSQRLQNSLQLHYSRCENINRLLFRFHDFLAYETDRSTGMANRISIELSRNHEELKKEIPEVIKLLNEEFTKSEGSQGSSY